MSSTAPAVLTLGVTGHRPDKLSGGTIARLTPAIAALLQKLQDTAQRARPTPPGHSALKVISPLAEGADRLIAQLALENGAGLIVPLPFARDLYARDFSSARSIAEFEAMLARAEQVVELNGDGASEAGRNAAYAAAGIAVADKSDLMLALWNGENADGRGGTAEIVHYARRIGRPVLWLPTVNENAQLLLAGEAITDHAVHAFLCTAAAIAKSRTAVLS